MHKAPVLASGIIVVLLLSTLTVISPSFSRSDEKGPYIDQATFIWREDENLALEEVRLGDLDTYFFRIPLEAADDAKNDARLEVYDRTAGSQGLFINPAPANDDLVPVPVRVVARSRRLRQPSGAGARSLGGRGGPMNSWP